MKLEALIFDVDGTLVDTEELHRQAFNQAFLEYGLPWDWDVTLYARLLRVSGGTERIAAFIDMLDLSAAERARLRRLVEAIHRDKTRIYGELIGSNGVRLRPGIARLIEEALQAGLTIGLAATSARANLHTLVSALFGSEARQMISAIACVSQVARRKPAPDIYELLLAMLRVKAAACVAFEDSKNGVAAANAAGLFVVATPSRWTLEQRFSHADLVLPSLGDYNTPLRGTAAARIGGAAWLGLAQLEALRAAPPGCPIASVHT